MLRAHRPQQGWAGGDVGEQATEPQTIEIKIPPFYGGFFSEGLLLRHAVHGSSRNSYNGPHLVVLSLCGDYSPNAHPPSSRPDCGPHGPEALFSNAAHSSDNRSHLPSPHTNHACFLWHIMDLVIVY